MLRNRKALLSLLIVAGIGVPLIALSGIAVTHILDVIRRFREEEQKAIRRYAELAARELVYRIGEAEGAVLRFLDLTTRTTLIESLAAAETAFPGLAIVAMVQDGNTLYEPGGLVGDRARPLRGSLVRRSAESLGRLGIRDAVRAYFPEDEPPAVMSFFRLSIGGESGLLGFEWSLDRIRAWIGDVAATALPVGWGLVVVDSLGRELFQQPAASLRGRAGGTITRVEVPLPDSDIPWRLRVEGVPSEELVRLARGEVVLSIGLVVFLCGLVVSGTWLLARTALREMEVARLKAAFAANVSHELRTPLALIRSAAEALIERESGMDRGKRIRYLDIIRRESRRLGELVETVLALTKAQHGRLACQLVPTDICRLVREVLETSRAYLEEQGFHVKLAVPGQALVAEVDEDALQLVLFNLLDNAVKFSADRKEIAVEVHGDGQQVKISVSDKGIGIAPEDQKRIFEGFYRVEREFAKKTRGAGIGLALSKEIVELHGGRIEVVSTSGQGSTFAIVLPVVDARPVSGIASGVGPEGGSPDGASAMGA